MSRTKDSDSKEDARIREILRRLEETYKGMRIALQFQNPLQLLIATILSAQCTDERVNAVTPGLFQRYPMAKDFARADSAQLEEAIRSTGFYHNKARSIIASCRSLVESFGGEVPSSLEDLVSLPGVGRKTANIVLGNAFGQQAIGVDTHVFRVSRRLGLSAGSDPDRVEAELSAILPRKKWTEATHWLIWHGRRICQAKKPLCPSCHLFDLCPWEGKGLKDLRN